MRDSFLQRARSSPGWIRSWLYRIHNPSYKGGWLSGLVDGDAQGVDSLFVQWHAQMTTFNKDDLSLHWTLHKSQQTSPGNFGVSPSLNPSYCWGFSFSSNKSTLSYCLWMWNYELTGHWLGVVWWLLILWDYHGKISCSRRDHGT